jgi:hypothetical protein
VTIVEDFRSQARACADLGSPMYAQLLDRAADDLDTGGVTAQVLTGHENDPGPSALALRLLGSVHRLVLERRAEQLERFYPSVGGSWDLDGGWAAFEEVLRSQPEPVRSRLGSPPQTNEVGRSAALMGGLLRLGEMYRLPVRLFEIGSSAGLNLNAERFGYTDEQDRLFGQESSSLVLRRAWQGRDLQPWSDLRIVERLGSDVMPVDVGTTEGRLTLTSYVWPDQGERLERLRRAFEIAAQHPVEVRRRGAASFVDGIELAEGTTTVLWHSVMWQYLSGQEQQRVTAGIQRLGAAATQSSPFAHLMLEPLRRTPDSAHEFLVVLQAWPTGERRILGTTVGHGIPTTWE